VEVYRSETREILKRYRADRTNRPEYVAALDFALLAAIPELHPADLPAVQAMLAENAQILREIDRMQEVG